MPDSRHRPPAGRAPATPGARCFVALWPDDAARGRLDALAAQLHAAHPGTRRMRRDNLHLTLAFIGELEPARQRAVAAALATIRPLPFDWTLDRIGAFAGARVLWAGGADAPPALAALAAQSRAALDALGVRYDRKPFAAHVTLLRDLRREQAAACAAAIEPPIAWRAAQPLLLQSWPTPQGVQYRELRPG